MSIRSSISEPNDMIYVGKYIVVSVKKEKRWLGSLVRGFDSSDLGLLVCQTFLDKGIVFCLLLLLAVEPATVEGTEAAAALQADRSDESLNFGRLGVGFGILLLRALDLPSDNILSYIVILAQVEELSDLGCTFGTESFGEDVVRQSRDLALALLDDDEGEDGDVGTDDTPTDGLALALTTATRAVARVSIGEEETDTVGKQNTLLHGESLLVVSTRDTDNVTLEFIT